MSNGLNKLIVKNELEASVYYLQNALRKMTIDNCSLSEVQGEIESAFDALFECLSDINSNPNVKANGLKVVK